MLLPMTKSAVIFAFLYVNTAYVMLFKYTNNYTFYNFFVIHPTFYQKSPSSIIWRKMCKTHSLKFI